MDTAGPTSCNQDLSRRATSFSGYQWRYFESMTEGPNRSRIELFLNSVRWDALLSFATGRRDGMACRILSEVGLGWNHMVRIIEFEDGVRWVARLALPKIGSPESGSGSNSKSSATVGSYKAHSKAQSASTTDLEAKQDYEALRNDRDDTTHIARGVDSSESITVAAPAPSRMECEYSTICLVRSESVIPTPRVHAIQAQNSANNDVGAPFMLMDCLPGNCGIDLAMQVPTSHRSSFYNALAKIHVQLASIRLPQIGKIISRNKDGTYRQEPIPGVGGPFDTATEYFEAWAKNASFGNTTSRLRAASGPWADEVEASVKTFPRMIRALADKLSTSDLGPFPLCHGDFGHNNVVVDDAWRILGVIDWEMAYAGPWEALGGFPLGSSEVPRAMDAPFNYNEDGSPKDLELVQKYKDQAEYVAAVRRAEDELGTARELSAALQDTRRRQVMTAMSLFTSGKAGLYERVVREFEERIKEDGVGNNMEI